MRDLPEGGALRCRRQKDEGRAGSYLPLDLQPIDIEQANVCGQFHKDIICTRITNGW
jgi:hypothetical protein